MCANRSNKDAKATLDLLKRKGKCMLEAAQMQALQTLKSGPGSTEERRLQTAFLCGMLSLAKNGQETAEDAGTADAGMLQVWALVSEGAVLSALEELGVENLTGVKVSQEGEDN